MPAIVAYPLDVLAVNRTCSINVVDDMTKIDDRAIRVSVSLHL